MMSTTAEQITPAMIARFVWSVHEYGGDDEFGFSADCDQICTDRLTGQVVVRYDLGDPANYAASHGGWSHEEWLRQKGFDPDAEIPLGDSAVPVRMEEAERHAAAKRRRSQREQEEAEAQELLTFLGDDAAAFKFEEWDEGEDKILTPALERRGFKGIGFYMIEQDSFGPLIRGCVAHGTDGKRVRFFYG